MWIEAIQSQRVLHTRLLWKKTKKMQQKNRQTQFHFMTFIDELENTEILKELKNTDNAGCVF